MRKISFQFFAYFLTLSTIFNPLLLAQESTRISNARALELVQSGKLQNALTKDADHAGLIFLDAKGDAVSLDSLIRSNPEHYSILSKPDERGNQIAINIRVQTLNDKEAKLAYYLHNYAVNKSLTIENAIDSTVVSVSNSDDAKKTQLSLERMINRFENAFQKTQALSTSQKNSVLRTLSDFLMSSAHASGTGTVLRSISYVGFGITGLCIVFAHVILRNASHGHGPGKGLGEIPFGVLAVGIGVGSGLLYFLGRALD